MNERFWKAGRYRARVSDVELIETASGKPAILVSVKPFSAIDDDGEVPVTSQYDQRIFLMSHDDTARGYTLKKLRLAGWEGGNFDGIAADMQGREIEVVATDDEYSGKQITRWDLPLPAKESKSVGSRSFNALFGNLLKADAKTRPAKKQAPAPEPVAADDEVPF